jgi:hypothetical protein
LHLTLSRPGRIAACVLALALAILTILLLTLGDRAPTASAEVTDSQTLCKGHIAAGEESEDDPEAIQVAYQFACSNPITGYILMLDHETQGFETEVFALDHTTKQVVPTDSFSCAGDVPGWSVNCTGTYSGKWGIVPGTFTISEKICDEPRVNPVFFTVRATVSAGRSNGPAIAVNPVVPCRAARACARSRRRSR